MRKSCLNWGLTTLLLIPGQAVAFTATCRDESVRAYRWSKTYDMREIVMPWPEDEWFRATWTFVWDPQTRRLTLNGQPLLVAASDNPDLILGYSVERAAFGIGVWSYALHSRHAVAVAAQVNAYDDVIAGGVLTRAVHFRCEFAFP